VKRGGPRMGRRGQLPKMPPDLQCTDTIDAVYRFTNTARTLKSITYQNLSGAAGGICTVVNSKVQSWASCLKVKSVTIWTGGDSTLGSAEVIWNSPVVAIEKENAKVTSQPSNASLPAVMISVPPKGTLARDWGNAQVNSSLTLFTIIAPIGCIIDVHMVTQTSNVYAAPAAQTVSAGALGIVYYLSLDGPGGSYTVVGRTTTN